ncbi:hypothetical protein [Marinovum sp.]|uniref:hypothetical protein n=1 Tax=Marinovum sp. TaxID=2024839 RepID=UPI002B277D18|nr:hypothetical protein [Marinovum sp.]
MKLLHAARCSLIAALCLVATGVVAPEMAQAQQTIVVRNDIGGLIQSRANKVSQMRATGQRVEILGTCLSSCTMYLGAGNVCISPNARFGFHGPSSYGRRLVPQDFERWSNVIASHFKPELQQWFMTTARHRINGFYRISGRQLIQLGYASC